MTTATPLFPLHTVLFPGGALALRIFEPRYVDMIARCLRGANRFGVLAIRQGSEVGSADTFTVGTLAEIVDWSEEAGGLLGIATIGREVFRVESTTRQPDGLYVGQVTLLAVPAPVALPARFEPLAALLRTVETARAPAEVDANYSDAGWVGCRLAEALPLAVPIKQSLLEVPDALVRLERIESALRAGGSHA